MPSLNIARGLAMMTPKEPRLPRHSSHILDMARKGAQYRYEELKAEIASLLRRFPQLRRAAAGISAAVAQSRRTLGARSKPVVRKHRRLSAAARQKIRQAQLRRWAKVRAGAKK